MFKFVLILLEIGLNTKKWRDVISSGEESELQIIVLGGMSSEELF